jgi:uncharacterized protein (TIGR00299 family) protein
MRRHLHLDCFSGLAGDMFLAACVDLGLPLEHIAETVARLGLPAVGVETRREQRAGITGLRFLVREGGQVLEEEPAPSHHHAAHAHGRRLAEISDLIARADLPAPVKERGLQLFHRLGEAEARIHGVPVGAVHFHEVGAVDAIVDLVGAAAAIEALGSPTVTCGPVNVGGGVVHAAHGVLPVPAPATAELVRGIPIYGSPDSGELLTPTGAVLLAELVDEFRELPPLRIEAIGWGLGKRETPGRPNAVRLMAGRREAGADDEVVVIETEIDNLPGEGFGFALERLLEGGALDAYFTPVQMKKNRPGVLVTVLARRSDLDRIAQILLAETGSLGCRFHPVSRFEAGRESTSVDTEYGPVAVKRSTLAGRPLAATPEYEDCRRLARARGVTWREVWEATIRAAASSV